MTPRIDHSGPRRIGGATYGVLVLVALIGLSISGYLAAVSHTAAGLPVGCGATGGCATVLTSRWAGTWGIPVALPATIVWGIAFVAAIRRNAAILSWTACAILLAAAWFIIVQIVVLGAICPWCMADHATGLLFGGIVLRALRPVSVASLVAAVAAMGFLIAGQFAVIYRPGTPGLLAGSNATGDTIEVGSVRFSPRDTPSWGGGAGASTTIVLLADFACPHCRAVHAQLAALHAAEPGRLQVLVAPVPMNHICNHTLLSTEERFQASCELAQLAIAVWKVAPESFAAFDAWLFAPETPRTAEEARREAERLVGAEALARGIGESPLPDAILRNVTAFEAVHARRLPVILRGGGASIEGEPASLDELDALLRGEGTSTPAP